MPFKTIKGIKVFIDPKTKKIGQSPSGHILFSEDEFDKLFNEKELLSAKIRKRVKEEKIPLHDPRNKELLLKNSELSEKVIRKRREAEDERDAIFHNQKMFAEII